VRLAPAPRNATFDGKPIVPLTLKVPARIRTTVFAGAEFKAALILAIDTVPVNSVLQAAVTQFAHAADGMPPVTPAADQSTARLGSMIPDQLCAWEYGERQSEMRENNSNRLRFINELLNILSNTVQGACPSWLGNSSQTYNRCDRSF